MDGKKALLELSLFERIVRFFWLLGPFFLLIERTPGDFYVSILALLFVFRSIKNRDGAWFKFFWVKSVFVFWGFCLLSAALSAIPIYSLSEAFIWIRFPLFAMATAFWLCEDKRLFHLMLISTAIALLLMCGILLLEIGLEGFKPRLSWPYKDLVPGNYLAKVGLPVVVFMSSMFVASQGRKSVMVGCFCLVVIGITMMTGERINFLILLCSSFLTIFVLEPSWKRRFLITIVFSLTPVIAFSLFPPIYDRFVFAFIEHFPTNQGGPYYKAMAPAWLIFEKFSVTGIGPGNFRYLCADLIRLDLGYHCHNHPHNFYLQILSETGFLGFVSAVVFIGSIIVHCFKAGVAYKHVLSTTAWIIPFALFWPIRSSADFFGQWNNIFLWSAVALALAVVHSKSKNT